MTDASLYTGIILCPLAIATALQIMAWNVPRSDALRNIAFLVDILSIPLVVFLALYVGSKMQPTSRFPGPGRRGLLRITPPAPGRHIEEGLISSDSSYSQPTFSARFKTSPFSTFKSGNPFHVVAGMSTPPKQPVRKFPGPGRRGELRVSIPSPSELDSPLDMTWDEYADLLSDRDFAVFLHNAGDTPSRTEFITSPRSHDPAPLLGESGDSEYDVWKDVMLEELCSRC